MTHVCLPDEVLTALWANRPEDDARRREIEACARCRSRLAAYREFLHPSDLPQGADPSDADTRLAAVLEAEILGRPGRATAASAAEPSRGAPGQRDRLRGSGGLWHRLWSPTLRPIWGVGIVLLAIWGVRSTGLLESRGRTEIQLRDGGQDPGRGIALQAPIPGASGGVRLTWSAVPGVDRYQVVVHGLGFVERMRIDAGPATTTTLADEAITRLSARAEPVYWRVLAYRNDDLVAESAIEPLNLSPDR